MPGGAAACLWDTVGGRPTCLLQLRRPSSPSPPPPRPAARIRARCHAGWVTGPGPGSGHLSSPTGPGRSRGRARCHARRASCGSGAGRALRLCAAALAAHRRAPTHVCSLGPPPGPHAGVQHHHRTAPLGPGASRRASRGLALLGPTLPHAHRRGRPPLSGPAPSGGPGPRDTHVEPAASRCAGASLRRSVGNRRQSPRPSQERASGRGLPAGPGLGRTRPARRP